MHVSQSLQGQLWGCHVLILDLKTSTLSQRFNSDRTISHIFGPKNLKRIRPIMNGFYWSCAEFRLKS